MNSVVALVVLGVLLGPVLLAAFWIVVLRSGLAPVRTELARLADALQLQNEISLDDELQRTT